MLGLFAAISVATGTVLVPAEAGHLYHAMAVFLAYGMMAVTRAGLCRTAGAFIPRFALIAGGPVLVRYTWLW